VPNHQVVKFKTRGASGAQFTTAKSSSSNPGRLRRQFITAKTTNSKPGAPAAEGGPDFEFLMVKNLAPKAPPGFELESLTVGQLPPKAALVLNLGS
jgi:hypothetical protein